MIEIQTWNYQDEATIRKMIDANNGRGIAIRGVSNQSYHDGPGLSSSDIKALTNGTIEAWLYNKKNPKEPTRALWLGNAIHCAVLEKDQFWNRYCKEGEMPLAPNRSTNTGKAHWAMYLAEHNLLPETKLEPREWQKAWLKWKYPTWTKEEISDDDADICFGIAKSVEKHPMVSQMFQEGENELSLYWIDKETDLLCKCRPDRLNHKFPCIPDLKSTEDASLDSFEADITSYGYYVSAYWYLWGAKEVSGFDYRDFVYIPAEKKPPFQVTFYRADEGSLGAGEAISMAGLKIYRRFLDTTRDGVTVPHGCWTGYSLEPKSAGIRPWAFNKISQIIHEHDLHNMGLEKYVGR